MKRNLPIEKSIIALLLAVVLLGCSGGESQKAEDQATEPNQVEKSTDAVSSDDTEQIKEIRFERVQSFGSTDEVVVGEMAGFSVDDQNRVFIADQDKNIIHVFNPDGSYKVPLGRGGRGPGEFSNIHILKINSGQLLVADANPMPSRIHIFSLDSLSFSHTISLVAENQDDYDELEEYQPHKFYPMRDGKLLVSYVNLFSDQNRELRTRRFFAHNREGRIVSDQIMELEYRYLVHEVKGGYTVSYGDLPFISRSMFTISDDNNIYAAQTENFLVKVYDKEGAYLREFEYPVSRRKIDRREIIENAANETRREVIANNELSERWPALESMFFDDENRLWVSTIIEENGLNEWWVLKKTGEVITKFEWPHDEPIEVVRNGYMYTRETDEKTGLQQIVKYRIEMN